MVSNMRFLQSSNPLAWMRRTFPHSSARLASMRSHAWGCNLSAAACRAVAIVVLFSLCAFTAAAQDSTGASAQPKENRAADTMKFVGGAALALALHESGRSEEHTSEL